MPIFWILVVGVLLYLALKKMENQYSLKNKKPSIAPPPPGETAATPLAVETVVAPPDVEIVEIAPSAETDPDPGENTENAIFIDTIPGLPQETKQELERMNLTTASAISNAADKILLSIKGIGPARLKQIRSLCAGTKS